MARTIDAERFLAELMQLFEETFEVHHGIYLDKGTSLFETLNGISAAQASRPMGSTGATVAAHVAHVDFYLGVIERFLLTRDTTPADWRAIWSTVRDVSPAEWSALQEELHASYQRVSATLRGVSNWDDGDTLSAAMGMVVHTAAHLGAIRQGLRALN
jgi:hypothetical protein